MRLKLVRPPPRPAVQGKFLAARAELDAALVDRDDENDLILTALVAGKNPGRPARVRQGDQFGTVPHRGNAPPRDMRVAVRARFVWRPVSHPGPPAPPTLTHATPRARRGWKPKPLFPVQTSKGAAPTRQSRNSGRSRRSALCAISSHPSVEIAGENAGRCK